MRMNCLKILNNVHNEVLDGFKLALSRRLAEVSFQGLMRELSHQWLKQMGMDWLIKGMIINHTTSTDEIECASTTYSIMHAPTLY
jgi:hypothetical protein